MTIPLYRGSIYTKIPRYRGTIKEGQHETDKRRKTKYRQHKGMDKSVYVRSSSNGSIVPDSKMAITRSNILTNIKGDKMMKLIPEWNVKLIREQSYRYETARITSPDIVYDFMTEVVRIQESPVEEFHILALNTKHDVIGVHLISKGTVNASIVHPREIFSRLYLNNATAFIAIHNHPTGDVRPSAEDISITKRLSEIADLHGIPLLDHIIVGYEGYESLAGLGKLRG